MIDPKIYEGWFEWFLPYGIVLSIIGLILWFIIWIIERRRQTED